MKPLAIPLCFILAACNPAKVDPPLHAEKSDANGSAPAMGGNRVAANEEPAFAATGQVRCVTRAGWAVRECAVGAVRGADGGTIVTIFHPEGRSRDILFDSSGRATGVRTAEQDGSDRQPFSAARAGHLTTVRLGAERYDIPDALVPSRR